MLLNLGLRNLLRQKRRNVMLGAAISLGVTILIVASSFSNGIEDIMFNKIVTYVAGHVSVNMNEGSGKRVPVFRDRERLWSIVEKNIPEGADMDEGLGIFTRAIGNGRADNMILVGVDTTKKISKEKQKEYDESFSVIDGSFQDLGRPDSANSVILSKERAESLNVKKNDVISIRFRNLFGQNQSERLNVIGVLKNENIFMQGVMFCELKNVKTMMGYRPYESANIHITVKDPKKNAIKVADRIQSALTPDIAFIYGKVSYNYQESEVTVIPFRGDEDSRKLMLSSFRLMNSQDGNIADFSSGEGVIISSDLAKNLGITTGTEVSVSYLPKFEKDLSSFKVKVRGIFESDKEKGSDTIYMHEAIFYPRYYDHLPDQKRDIGSAFIPEKGASFRAALGKEWELLDRTRNTDEMRKKYAAQARKKIKATTVDVNSMYESASDVLKLESVLNIITLSAVLILFVIILIGVINTLRMTIRERTKEIGTLRAIGMQKRDVWSIFMIETSLLSLFASIAGTMLAFILMWLLGFVTFNVTDNPLGILLVRNHLYFLPTAQNVLFNIALILVITAATAYFPARRAANLPASEALRHYE